MFPLLFAAGEQKLIVESEMFFLFQKKPATLRKSSQQESKVNV
jgi:hypothetical protein